MAQTSEGRIEVSLRAAEDPNAVLYKHKTLGEGQVRLMQVSLCRINGKLELKVKFEVAAVEELENQLFFALSYTWGAADSLKSVLCDNGVIYITPNLYDALCALQAQPGGWDNRYWIDQICIDQRNIVEKSQQVKVMAQIYAQAAEVWVWLSKELWEHASADLTLDSLYTICASQLEQIRAGAAYISWDHFIDTGRPEFQQLIESLPLEWWEVAALVLTHPYFLRVWVIQEIVKSKEAKVLVSGFKMPWVKLAGITLWLHRFTIPQGLIPETLTRPQIEAAERIVTLKSHYGQTNRRPPEMKGKSTLLDLVILASGCKSTDCRDKVYGLLGLLDNPLVCTPQEVQVDYSVDFQTLLRRTAVDSILQSETLEHLAFCNPFIQPCQPSWLPYLDNLDIDITFPYSLGSLAAKYHAGGPQMPSVLRVEGRDDVLSFAVRRIGAVKFIGRLPERTVQEHEANMRKRAFEPPPVRLKYYEYIARLRECCRLIFGPRLPDMSEWSDVVRMLMCDMGLNNRLSLETSSLRVFKQTILASMYSGFLKAVENAVSFDRPTIVYRSGRDRHSSAGIRPEKIVASGNDSNETRSLNVGIALDRIRQEMPRSLYDRLLQEQVLLEHLWSIDNVPSVKYWITPEGMKTFHTMYLRNSDLRFAMLTPTAALNSYRELYTAWIPAEAKHADQIVAIQGFSFPMLIRQGEDGTYKFLGISYVHSFMEGGLWQESRTISEHIVVA